MNYKTWTPSVDIFQANIRRFERAVCRTVSKASNIPTRATPQNASSIYCSIARKKHIIEPRVALTTLCERPSPSPFPLLAVVRPTWRPLCPKYDGEWLRLRRKDHRGACLSRMDRASKTYSGKLKQHVVWKLRFSPSVCS